MRTVLALLIAASLGHAESARADSHRHAYMVLKCSNGNHVTTVFHFATMARQYHGADGLEEAILARFAKDHDGSRCDGYTARFTKRELAEKYWGQMVEGVRQFCPGGDDGESHCTGAFTFVKVYQWPPPRVRIRHEGLQNCVRGTEWLGEACGDGTRLFVTAENQCSESFQIQVCIERLDQDMDCALMRKVDAGQRATLSACDSTGNWWYIACPTGQACEMRN